MTAVLSAPAPARGEECRAAARALALSVFDRAGTPVPVIGLDRHLAAIADEAIGLYMRAVERDEGLPLPLITDLLTTVAALRAVLGMNPTPVNGEVYYWGYPGG